MLDATIRKWLTLAVCLGAVSALASQEACRVQSGPTVTPVIELYTSEGCSSCPPADRWLSKFRFPKADAGPVVVQAFHVGYWDYIGWIDRFATPAHTVRQKQVASWNGANQIYTPQAVLNGRDWQDWTRTTSTASLAGRVIAHTAISLQQTGPDQFEATVSADSLATVPWSAYWTVTEHGHSSRVKAGENAGELLQHDYVVRQYTPAGDYSTGANVPQKLQLRSVAKTPGHARQVNLVVFDKRTGVTLQAVSAGC